MLVTAPQGYVNTIQVRLGDTRSVSRHGMRNGISYWRKKRQLSRNKLAAAIGTTPLAIEKLEKGVLQLSINTLAR